MLQLLTGLTAGLAGLGSCRFCLFQLPRQLLYCQLLFLYGFAHCFGLAGSVRKLLAQGFAFLSQGLQALVCIVPLCLQGLDRRPPAEKGAFPVLVAAAGKGTAGIKQGTIKTDDTQAVSVFTGRLRRVSLAFSYESFPQQGRKNPCICCIVLNEVTGKAQDSLFLGCC